MKIHALAAALFIAFSSFVVAAPGAGDVAPVSLGVDRDGNPVDLGQAKDRVQIVTFWATWCGPCQKELPILEGIQRVAKDRVRVVAVNIEDRAKFRKVASTLKSLTLTVAHDDRADAREAYGVHGIPHLVIIGRDGKIIAVHRGYSEAGVDGIIAEINRALAPN